MARVLNRRGGASTNVLPLPPGPRPCCSRPPFSSRSSSKRLYSDIFSSFTTPSGIPLAHEHVPARIGSTENKPAGERRHILFLHGLLGSGRNWKGNSESILKEDPKGDLEGWLVDLRNHGASPHDAYMTLSAMASDVALLMQNLSMKSAVVLGHSMGGKVAMKLADTHPKLVAKLIVVDVAPVRTDMSKSDIPEIIDSLLAVPLPTLQSRKEVDAFLAKRIPSVFVRGFLLQNLVHSAEMQRLHWRVPLEEIRDGLSLFMEDNVLTPPSKYKGPALFVGGSASDYLSETNRGAVKAAFPQAEVTMMHGVGHYPHIQRPKEFADIVSSFLNIAQS